MKKIILIFVASALIVGGGSFYGGMSYQKSKSPLGNFSRQNFQGNAAGALRQGIGSRGAGAGFLSGQVLAKDQQSLTLKMQDGSSKIVFFSDTTQISKIVAGTANDVEIGKEIMVNGQQNSDGSYTAQTIQLSTRSMIQ